MIKPFSFFEFGLEPDLDTFSDNDLKEITQKYVNEGRNIPHCSTVTVKHSRGQGPVIPSKYLTRIQGYESKIKLLYWERLQTRPELPPDSYLLDLIPGVHWMYQSLEPAFGNSRLVDSRAPKEYVIPEIIRPYVDFINSIYELRPIIKENFVGVVNFQIFQGGDLENALYCHLVYDGDGKLTLIKEAHPNPDLSLVGAYSSLSRLFHLGEKHPERGTARKSTGPPDWRLVEISGLEWKMNHYFGDRPGTLPRGTFLYPQFRSYSPTPRPSTWYEQFKKWCYTLLKVESLSASKFDTFYTPAVKRCVVSFNDTDKLTLKIFYRNEGEAITYYPQSLFECFCVFEFIIHNLYGQVLKIYHKPRKKTI